jgi:hypothetical protein
MMTTKTTRLGVVLASALLMACGAAGGVPGAGGGGGKVDPNACEGMDASDVGKKLKVFLEATAKLQTAAADLEAKAKQACTDILTELGGSAKGTTKETCDAAAAAIQENMKASLKAEAKIEAKYKPAECTVNAEAQASAQAQCSGSASGTAGTGGSGGSADAACSSAAEVNASIEVECKPAEWELTVEASMVADASKFEKVKAALAKGMPSLLEVTGRAQVLAKAVVNWSKTAKDLAASADSFAKEFAGKAALCVSGQLAAAGNAAASVDVQVNVSVEASASVGGSASGGAGG